MLKFKIIALFVLLLPAITFSQGSWTNPLSLSNEWSSYGIGDPYVLKHKGIYYLYCSTKDTETGIKVWSSKDLITWGYQGLCTTEPITRGAYAPEVIYWNGTFYMYTSPAGNGHYALTSDSPTGPFAPISGNFGRSIDGSVFIDDDARWYFYYASPGGIRGSIMSGPATMGSAINVNAVMNNTWTEGATVFKRNGIYYITYTGNHIWSMGYRIDYASNSMGPVASYSPARLQNPIILNTENNHYGLGHGSVFIGPDLDSYFFTYHNLINRVGQGLPWRKLNFDRIAWNGKKLIVLGPTTFAQQAPQMPDTYDFFDRTEMGTQWQTPLGGSWGIHNAEYLYQDQQPDDSGQRFIAVLDNETANDFTAEFNFRQEQAWVDNPRLGAVFNYTNTDNYGYAVINSQTNELEISFISGGVSATPVVISVPADFDYSVWHILKIEKMGNTYKFFLNNLHLATQQGTLTGGSIGYLSEGNHAQFSFIAFSNKVNGSGVFDVYKPIPGTIDAVLYNTGGQGEGFMKINALAAAPNALRTDGLPAIEVDRGGYAVQALEAGEWLKYNVNIRSQGSYNVGITYSNSSPESKVRIWLDETAISDVIDLDNIGNISQYRTQTVKDIDLPAGYQTLRIEVVEGSINLYSLQFVLAQNASFDQYTDFRSGFGIDWRYADGSWSINNSVATIDGTGKRTFGHPHWADYMVETNIRFQRSMNAGIMLRVNNPSLGGAGDDAQLGADYLQGYFVGFNFSSIILGKQNYNWQLLKSATGQYELNKWYHLRAIIKGDQIDVYVDDMTHPVISYVDSIPFLNGRAGIRSFNTHVEYNDFRVTSSILSTDTPSGLEAPNDLIVIYPNPASSRVTVQNGNKIIHSVSILTLDGKEIASARINNVKAEFDLPPLPVGVYIIRVASENEMYHEKITISQQ